MALFPTDRVNAVPLQYEPTFADLAGRPVQAESRLPETPFLDLVTSFDFRSDMSRMREFSHRRRTCSNRR